jgi:hypothetical protein
MASSRRRSGQTSRLRCTIEPVDACRQTRDGSSATPPRRVRLLATHVAGEPPDDPPARPSPSPQRRSRRRAARSAIVHLEGTAPGSPRSESTCSTEVRARSRDCSPRPHHDGATPFGVEPVHGGPRARSGARSPRWHLSGGARLRVHLLDGGPRPLQRLFTPTASQGSCCAPSSAAQLEPAQVRAILLVVRP